MRKIVVAFALGVAVAGMAAEPVTLFDFADGAKGWTVNRDAKLLDTRPGMSAELNGVDPWFEGPAVDIPSAATARKLRILLDAESSASGPNRWEIFYAEQGKAFSAGQMVYLEADPKTAGRLSAMIPVYPKMRFRIDPPGTSGTATLHALRVVPMAPLAELTFEKPEPVVATPNAVQITKGAVVFEYGPNDRAGPSQRRPFSAFTIEHSPDRWNAMALFVDGKKMAETNPAEYLMYHDGTKAVKVPLSGVEARVQRVYPSSGGTMFVVRATVRDAGGAVWTLERDFMVRSLTETVSVQTTISVSEAREVLHLPWLTLFSGVGTFGERKSQALLPGVEYLDDEPSSNEKEIRGPAANRRMVADYKICYPMATLVADGCWFSMSWPKEPDSRMREKEVLPFSTLFDSPDRVFNSGGHVMGLWSPAVGEVREENGLDLYGTVTLEAGKKYTCTVTLAGGKGDTVVEAVKKYIPQRERLDVFWKLWTHPRPAAGLFVAGWLDSKARDGTKFRHAVWPGNFGPQPAQDPPAYLLWLEGVAEEPQHRERAAEMAHEIIASLPKDATGVDGISHVWRPTGAFLYGNLDLLVQRAAPKAKQIAERLADGTATYKPAQGKPDYASTLGATHCNGFTAISAEEMLAHATLTGDEEAIRAALAVLDKMTGHYAGTVPRGAQPWEMPLHTPDILASARLVRCYVLGYLLSGNEAYLEQARYWAWTGLTMVYLASPVGDRDKVGLYATIGVIGATDWVAPNWIGQPVQWCGLVYRSALEDLARIDAKNRDLWKQVAQGITMAGVAMCFPLDDPEGRCGLLPDYWLLKQQIGEGPAINPGTLQAGLAEAYGKPPLYTVMRLSDGSLFHLPGDVQQEEAEGVLRLKITTWVRNYRPPLTLRNGKSVQISPRQNHDYRVLLTRVSRPPSSVKWHGNPVERRFLEDAKVLIVTLEGDGVLEIVK